MESLLCVEAFSAGDVPARLPTADAPSAWPTRWASSSPAVLGLHVAHGCGHRLGSLSRWPACSRPSLWPYAFAAGSFMGFLPRCALSAIVVVALLDIVDFGRSPPTP
ncbi:MAG: hypothetical protein ACLUW6_03170 [Coriobacteriaceae bacterium]